MVGVLSIPLWSTPASRFSLLEDVSCLREWFGLQMKLVRGIKELISLEQTSANEKWELVEKHPRFSPSVGQLWTVLTAVSQRNPYGIEPCLYYLSTQPLSASPHFCLTFPILTVFFEISFQINNLHSSLSVKVCLKANLKCFLKGTVKLRQVCIVNGIKNSIHSKTHIHSTDLHQKVWLSVET